MKVYFDAVEQVALGLAAETVRLDITDKTQEEQDAILASLKDYMNLNGSTNIFTKHYCYHDEGRLCEVEVV